MAARFGYVYSSYCAGAAVCSSMQIRHILDTALTLAVSICVLLLGLIPG